LAEHLRGRIETFDLVDLLQWLEVKRASGRLTLGRGEDRKTIDWKEGDIVYVSGNRPHDRLGHVLAASHEIPLPALYSVFAKNFAGKSKLTRLLFEEQLITREVLASIVEQLARRLLKEALAWRRGRFDFDPEYGTEDLLQIHLRLKSQVLAFQVAKDLDDSARTRPAAGDPESGETESWERYFRAEAVDDAFWKVAIEAERDSTDPEKIREEFVLFHRLARALHGRLSSRMTFLPIYEDSARYAADLLALGDESEKTLERLIGVINLDPRFTLNLLHLANALTTSEADAVASCRQALQRIGFEALRTLISCLNDENYAFLSSEQPWPRALRRAALAAGVAARGRAPAFGVDPEEAYTAGMLHAVSYSDVVTVLQDVQLPAGPFRAAAIEYFRPLVGRVRSRAWGLPEAFCQVLADNGKAEWSPLVMAIRSARAHFPRCAVGPLHIRETGGPHDPRIESELRRVFDFLNLGPP
jgi:hypothetical protein